MIYDELRRIIYDKHTSIYLCYYLDKAALSYSERTILIHPLLVRIDALHTVMKYDYS